MRTYKVYMQKDKELINKNKLAELFDGMPDILETKDNTIFGIKFNPEDYVFNEKKIIGKIIQFKLKPLVMTNFKFLMLLVEMQKTNMILKSFEIKNDDNDNEETESIMSRTDENINGDLAFFENNDMKIKFIEIGFFESYSRFTVYSNGIISATDRFSEEEAEELARVIEFLFKGNNL